MEGMDLIQLWRQSHSGKSLHQCGSNSNIEVKHVGLVIDVKDVILLSSFPYFPPVFVKRIFDFQS